VITSRLDHVGMVVHDLDRSLAFYHDLLGIPLLGRGEDIGADAMAMTGDGRRLRYADLDLGGRILELLQYVDQADGIDNGQDAPRIHVGILVTDLTAMLARLRGAGIIPRSEPIELSEPAHWAGARCVYVSDPDGLTIELVERRSR